MTEYMLHVSVIVEANDGDEATKIVRQLLADAGIRHAGLSGRGLEIIGSRVSTRGSASKASEK